MIIKYLFSNSDINEVEKKAMLSKCESNDSQNLTNAIPEEPKANRDAQSDESLKNSIKTGTCALIHLFDRIFSFFFYSFNFQT